jgi:hypothetical protein
MFNVNFTNNYFLLITGMFMTDQPPPPGGGYQVFPVQPGGGKLTVENLGNFQVSIPGMGELVFLDIAAEKLPAYTNPEIPWTEATWGGVIRYRGEDAYFRYEGQGQVNVVIDQFGSVTVNFPQGGMQVSLSELSVV